LQCIPILRFLGERLTVVVRLRRDGIDRQEEMVGGDSACYARGEGSDTGDGFGGGGVLEDDAEVREVGGEATEVGEEMFFGVEDGDVLARVSASLLYPCFPTRVRGWG